MYVSAAYLGIIIIWSTTPLTVKWSGEGSGFLFGVSSRMLLSLVLCLIFIKIFKVAFPWNREARHAYFSASIGIYGAMVCCYWGAQLIPSGLISVVFGLTPIITCIMAVRVLKEQSLTPMKIFGMIAGFMGLAVIFGTEFSTEVNSWKGIGAIFFAVLLYSFSTVLVKRSGTSLAPIALNCGGLAVSLPLYIMTWFVFDGVLPDAIPSRTLLSIIYLGVAGSLVGFILFFYVLKHMEAGRVALITLITPVIALFIGQAFNGEVIQKQIWIGTVLIMMGLAIHQWGHGSYRPVLLSKFFK